MKIKKRGISYLIDFGLLALLLYTPLLRATKDLSTMTATSILILILAGLWFLKMCREENFRFVRTSLNLPLFIFLLLAVYSTLFSINKGKSLWELYKLITFFILYFLLVNHLRERYHFRAFILALLGVAGGISCYGLYQYFSRWPNLIEVASTFPPNPNSLAGYLLLVIPLAISITLWAEKKWLFRFAFAVSLLTFTSLLTTYSRGGYLAFLGSLMVFISLGKREILKRKFRLFSLLAALLGVISSLCIIQLVSQPLLKEKAARILKEPPFISSSELPAAHSSILQRTSANKFIVDRLRIWGKTLKIIGDYPLFGSGMGTYGIIFKTHKIPLQLTEGAMARYSISARFAHNEYLQIATETGLPSLIVFLWIIGLVFRTGLRALTKVTQFPRPPMNRGCSTVTRLKEPANRPTGQPANFQSYLTIGLLSGLSGILLHSLVDFVLRPPATDILFLYFVAFIMITSKKEVSRTSSTPHLARILPHLYHSSLIRASLIISLTLIMITQVSLPLLSYKSYRRGREYQKEAVFDLALSRYFIAQRLNPLNDRYYKVSGSLCHYLAQASEENKDFWFEKAISEYQRMVLLSPWDGHYRKDLGLLCWLASSRGKVKPLVTEAIFQLQESLRIDPTFAFAYGVLGVIWTELGRVDEAIENFQAAVSCEPNYSEAHYNLAQLYCRKGWFAEAEKEYQKILEIGNKKVKDDIICNYEKLLLTFDYALAHYRLGALYEREGRLAEAEAQYSNARRLHPESSDK